MYKVTFISRRHNQEDNYIVNYETREEIEIELTSLGYIEDSEDNNLWWNTEMYGTFVNIKKIKKY